MTPSEHGRSAPPAHTLRLILGDRLDPHRHQAMSMEPADLEPNTVVRVMQKGYLLADRVLRPAMVIVAAPKA